MQLKNASGKSYILEPMPIGSGGEGDIYPVRGATGQVAKIYKPGAMTKELEEKLKVMVSNPPDNFALAIHIFKLLMNGYAPFGGIIESASVSQSSPGVGDTAVKRDNYCFKPGFKHQSAAILPLEAFPQQIADLFTKAFIVGKHDPQQRPSGIAEKYVINHYTPK